ncbi:hypothetical protein O1611_g5703 [Lasiodiplodia mahajangana]|uniref:Uncharacterized protein n=1 Tax=Lasiodiplodia mahajangana TaxID=1108764 RepID=A0ACC2JL02_9PEZI|nr:hypothetical protein O1611_g5703 [Lasiodiplodia mahajangana]
MKGVGTGAFALGTGKAKLTVQRGDDTKDLILTNVLYVPYMELNLISIGCFTVQQGFRFEQDRHGAQIIFTPPGTNRRTLILHGRPHNKFHLLEYSVGDCLQRWNPPEMKGSAMAYISEGSAPSVPLMLLHQRLGHINFDTCRKVAKEHNLQVTNDYNNIICESCVLGKGAAQNNHTTVLRATRRGARQHADLGGPVTPVTATGERYYLLIVDDMTRLPRVYLLKHKSDAQHFIQLDIQWVEAQTGMKVQFFRVDNGGEFKNHVTIGFLTARGTQPEFTAPYQHEQLGLVERLHRTLWGLIRSILSDSKLPPELWGEILRASVWIWSRTPNSTLNNMSPYEAWTGRKPNTTFWKRLGCKAYKLVPKETYPTKLDDRAQLTVLVGYDADNIYRLWNTSTGTIERVKEAIFDENVVLGHTKDLTLPILSPNLPAPPSAEMVLQHAQLTKHPLLPAEQPSALERLTAQIQAGNREKESASKLPYNPLPRNDSLVNKKRPADGDEVFSAAVKKQRTDAKDTDTAEALQWVTDGDQPETVPQEWAFLEDVNRRIEELENYNYNNQIPIWSKLQPRDMKNLDISAYYTAVMYEQAWHSAALSEPRTYKEALQSPHAEDWLKGMNDEIQSIIDNQSWDIIDDPGGLNILSGKWVYKIKLGLNNEVLRYKARWVARGFEQTHGIDFQETFASVIRQKTYRTLFALAAREDWDVDHLDVKTAFLYGDIDGDVYMHLPPGFEQLGKICKLRKALYGLKQSPRIWYNLLSKVLLELGWTRSRLDEALFYKDKLILAVYVDDILIFGKDTEKIAAVKADLSSRFQITDLGPCKHFLGMEVHRDRPNRKLWLTQTAYLTRVLKRFFPSGNITPRSIPMDPGETLEPAPKDFHDSTIRKEYQEIVGSLMYAMVGTRPDLAYSVSKLSRFLVNPTRQHLEAAKNVLRYVAGTLDYGLEFDGNNKTFVGFTDAEYARDRSDSVSTECYIFTIAGAAISWKSRKQTTIATSSCNSEYFALYSGALEGVYLQYLLDELQVKLNDGKPVSISVDNNGAKQLTDNPIHHERTKHIRVKYHKTRELVREGSIIINWIPRTENPADMGTKALPRVEFQKWRNAVGVRRFAKDLCEKNMKPVVESVAGDSKETA